MKATKFGIIFETFLGIFICFITLSTTNAETEAKVVKKLNLTAIRCGKPEFEPIIKESEEPIIQHDTIQTHPSGYRIISGTEAKEHSWPWMVSIHHNENADTVCGGSLVTRNTVLTAAHCLKGFEEAEPIKVKLGMHSKFDKIDDVNIIEIDVKSFDIHEQYNNNVNNSQYDIALLTLQHPINYTQWISPICIGEKRQLSVNSTCFVTGWGYLVYRDIATSNFLQQLSLPIIDDETCVKVNSKANVTTQFCAGFLDGVKDSCQGDSGGPVVCKDTEASPWRIHGIVSYGDSCAKKGKLGVYTRVSFFRRWLHEHMNNMTTI